MNNFVTFDASVKDGKIGVGIHDNLNKKSRHYSSDFDGSSYEAEMIALGCALKYCVETRKNTKNEWVHLFTDNKGVAKNGIPAAFRHFEAELRFVNLTWIPRELNTLADKVSKLANVEKRRKLNIKKKEKALKSRQKQKTESVKSPTVKRHTNAIREMFRQHSFDDKMRLFSNLAVDKNERELLRLCEEGVENNYSFRFSKSSENFIKLVHTVFGDGEISHYARKRIGKTLESGKVGKRNKTIKMDELKAFLKKREYLQVA
jgi:hypothetical protein